MNDFITVLRNFVSDWSTRNTTGRRGVICDGKRGENFTEPIARVVSVYCLVYCVIDYQTVMRSCYKPGKILSNAWWERTKVHSEIEAFREKHEVPRRKRRLLSLFYVRCYSSAVITFGGFPEHWIIFYLRFRRRPNDRLLDSTVQKQRRCAVLNVKFN